MTDDVTRRSFWIVSPNVRDNNKTVSEWRQASVACRSAFMGYGPQEQRHKQIGYKFAYALRENDVVLIARRFHNKPEVVGFGVVSGSFETRVKGFRTPESFGSLRKLSPFLPLSAAPSDIRIMSVLRHTTALRQLHPKGNPDHKAICDWMERRLAQKVARAAQDPKRHQLDPQISTELTHEYELEYEIRSKAKVIRAKKAEAELLNNYRTWLDEQRRRLVIVNYKSLRCDAYEEDRANLIEAKCSVGREYIRMAVGQLLEYSYLGRSRIGKTNLAILLPAKPDLKSLEWLSELQISVVWKERDVFLDNANGQFS